MNFKYQLGQVVYYYTSSDSVSRALVEGHNVYRTRGKTEGNYTVAEAGIHFTMYEHNLYGTAEQAFAAADKHYYPEE